MIRSNSKVFAQPNPIVKKNKRTMASETSPVPIGGSLFSDDEDDVMVRLGCRCCDQIDGQCSVEITCELPGISQDRDLCRLLPHEASALSTIRERSALFTS